MYLRQQFIEFGKFSGNLYICQFGNKVSILSLCTKNTGTLKMLLKLFALYVNLSFCFEIETVTKYLTIYSHNVLKTFIP